MNYFLGRMKQFGLRLLRYIILVLAENIYIFVMNIYVYRIITNSYGRYPPQPLKFLYENKAIINLTIIVLINVLWTYRVSVNKIPRRYFVGILSGYLCFFEMSYFLEWSKFFYNGDSIFVGFGMLIIVQILFLEALHYFRVITITK